MKEIIRILGRDFHRALVLLNAGGIEQRIGGCGPGDELVMRKGVRDEILRGFVLGDLVGLFFAKDQGHRVKDHRRPTVDLLICRAGAAVR